MEKPKALHGESVEWNEDLQTYTKQDQKDEQLRYFWDEQRRVWFPIIDGDQALTQQSAYDSTALKKKRKRNNDDQVVNVSKSSVYVSGLPSDVSVTELADYFKKCGVILPDLTDASDKNALKIKLYRNEDRTIKGDALVTYFREESVPLAVTMLDDTELRPNVKISVQRADFTANKSKQSKNKQDSLVAKVVQTAGEKRAMQIQLKQQLDKKLGWDETAVDADQLRAQRTVVLQHVFTSDEMKDDPAYALELKESMYEECGKIGPVTLVRVLDRNPSHEDLGVVSVRFKEATDAMNCLQVMNGRWFGGRQLEAFIYDGVTDYGSESLKDNDSGEPLEQESEKRLDEFAKWLENS